MTLIFFGLDQRVQSKSVKRVAIIRRFIQLYKHTYFYLLLLGFFLASSLVQLRKEAMPKQAYTWPKEAIQVDSSLIKSVEYTIGGVPHDRLVYNKELGMWQTDESFLSGAFGQAVAECVAAPNARVCVFARRRCRVFRRDQQSRSFAARVRVGRAQACKLHGQCWTDFAGQSAACAVADCMVSVPARVPHFQGRAHVGRVPQSFECSRMH